MNPKKVPAEAAPARGVGNNRSDLRQHNLSVVLNLVHRSRSISRSELTAMTGLNRSTTLDLVGALSERGLVVETETETARSVGRPSIKVYSSESIVSFAVVPTKHSISVAAVAMDGTIKEKIRESLSPYSGADETAKVSSDLISGLRRRLKAGTRISGVGVSISGQVNVATNVVRHSPFLGWIEEPFGARLAELTGLPVKLDNNSTITCAAERDFGAGRGFKDIVYLMGAEGGIGGGVVVDGNLLRGTTGYAGELGHIRISDSRLSDSMGLEGTLEALVRREELEEALGLENADDAELRVALSRRRSNKVERVLNREIDLLGIGIANLVNIFNPELVLLAGFLSELFNADDYRLMSQVRKSALAGARERVQIRTAELGPNLQLIGAAQLGFADILADPIGATLFARDAG
jgi:predicted NBD/HSP70 family sugar kinase